MINYIQDRTCLHDRHRLSHQQIDRLLDEKLSKDYLHEKIERIEMVKAFFLITDTLKKHGISFINLKGPLLSHRIYGDATVRYSNDIDILIAIEDLVPVMEILQKNGYSLNEGYVWPENKIQQELYLLAVHHLGFYNKDIKLLIEIHWEILSGISIPSRKLKKVISDNLTEIVLSGRTFKVFSSEFELLYLMIHGAKHGWHRIKWLVDLNDYPLQDINRASFNSLVKLLNAQRIVGQTNFLLLHFFNNTLPFKGHANLPTHFTSTPLHNIVNDLSEMTLISESVYYYRYQWLLFKRFYYKLQFIKHIFHGNMDIPNVILPFKAAYYLYRPYSFVKRRIL
jgi:hypothetical protein